MTDEEKAAAAAAAKAAEEAAAAEAARKAAEEAEKDKTKKPTDKEAELLKEVMDKKDKLKTSEASLKAAQDALKAYEGIDPVQVRKLLDAQKKAEEAQLLAAGDFERLKTRMAEEHTKEVQAKDGTITTLQGEVGSLKSMIEELTVGQAFSNSKFIGEELLLTPAKARVVYGAHFEVEAGVTVAYDKPRGSKERTKLVDARGNPVPFEDAIKKLVEADSDRDSLLRSKLKGGSDAKPIGIKPPLGEKTMTGRERIAAALSKKK